MAWTMSLIVNTRADALRTTLPRRNTHAVFGRGGYVGCHGRSQARPSHSEATSVMVSHTTSDCR